MNSSGIITTHQAECMDCYRCLRNCPVKAIGFVTGQAKVEPDRCILCGRCVVECPQKAKVYRNEADKVRNLLYGEEPVVLSIAPSYLGSFDQSPAQLFAQICRAGFADVEETAIGATLTTREYRRLLMSPEWQNKTGLSTCCPVIVNLVEKYYPKLRDNLLPALSPMVSHARLIKSQRGENCRVVFAGPCIGKLEEAEKYGLDAALTFGQLKVLLLEKSTKPPRPVPEEFAYKGQWIPTRSFPIHNGVLYSLKGAWGSNQDFWSIEGIDQCLEVLKALKNGDIAPRFIEMMACVGGCVGGPAIDSKYTLYKRKQIIQDAIKESQKLPLADVPPAPFSMGKEFKGRPVHDVPYTEAEIEAVLHKMGKNTHQDQRNCEGCGYDSCRDKAIAVLDGMATMEMCVPYMRAKAESVAHTVMENTPNGILVLDDAMTVRDCNPAVRTMLKEVPLCVGLEMGRYMDVGMYRKSFRTKTNIYDQRIEYPQWQLVTRQTIVPVPSEHLLMVIFEDVTKLEGERTEMATIKASVMEKAKTVINQQMRVAQDIAGLLGETTAETKATLYELLKHLEDNDHENLL
ncbi:MAG: [Fe-Fe] hydrogenase large subunit C-terminal domain-containing protein [Peptococcaceae bacterium]|nr:[Fe-Fe] hydrogenase large subunit C-terminal domain-containing protein [Peptococcaceae bacterium]